MKFESEFDAVFSNAALHWMLDRAGVVAGVARALKKGGRFVAEMGGKGNVRILEGAIEKIAAKYHDGPIPERRTYYPALGEYAALLEEHGLEVRFAQLFDRPTPLEGEDGMANWVRQFKWYYFEALRAGQQEEALREIIEELRPALRSAGRLVRRLPAVTNFGRQDLIQFVIQVISYVALGCWGPGSP